MSSRRMTLGSMSQNAVNQRAGQSMASSRDNSTKRMSVGAGAPRMSMGVNQMPANSTASRRMSVGANMNTTTKKESIGHTSNNNRKSSVSRGSTLTGRTVDNRDIQSKAFMHSGINTVLNYLMDHNYDHPISTKVLQIPAARDFQNIITFLFRQLDPQFEFKDRFEDEVVTMFKFLGYPTQISKSNLTAVGSPHAWPNILAATVWLIELLSYDESVAKGPQSDDTELVSDKAFFDYIATAYSLFMSGKDSQFASLEKEFSDSLEAKNTLVEEQVSLLEDRNATLNADLTVVNNRRAELPRLEEKRAMCKQDLVKFEGLLRQLTDMQSNLQSKTQDREIEMERLTKTLNSINEELESLQHRIDNQELSAEDVSKLTSQKRTLEQAQQRASEHRQAIQKRAWNGETNLRDKHQELIDLAHAYNTVAEDLKLIPMTAKNAKGRKFKIEVNINAEKIENILKTDIQETMTNLESLSESLEKQVQSVTKELYTQQEELEEIETGKQELEQKRELTQAKIQRTEETYNKEKEELDKLITMHGTEMSEMEQRLIKLRHNGADEARAKSASRRVEEIQANSQRLREEHVRTKQEIIDDVMEVITNCAAHRELVRETLDDLKQNFIDSLSQQMEYNSKFEKEAMPPAPPLEA